MKTKYRKITLVLLMVVLIFGCTPKAPEAQSGGKNKLEAIQAKGTLVVGTSADFPPYEFRKAQNGGDTFAGFEMEIARQVAKDLGVQIEIKDMKFEEVIPALVEGKVDMALAGIVPTEERKQKVDFSMVYFDGKTTMLVRTEQLERLNQIQHFGGKRVGAQKGSIQEALASEKFQKAKIVLLPKIPDLVDALRKGTIDGVLLDQVVAAHYDVRNDDLVVNDLDLGSQGGVAIAMPKDSERLKTKVDSLLKRLLEDGSIERYVTDANLNQ